MQNKYYKVVRRCSEKLISALAGPLPEALVVEYIPGVRTFAPAGQLMVFSNFPDAKSFANLSDEIWEVAVGNPRPVERLIKFNHLHTFIKRGNKEKLLDLIVDLFTNFLSVPDSYLIKVVPRGTVGVDWVILERKMDKQPGF